MATLARMRQQFPAISQLFHSIPFSKKSSFGSEIGNPKEPHSMDGSIAQLIGANSQNNGMEQTQLDGGKKAEKRNSRPSEHWPLWTADTRFVQLIWSPRESVQRKKGPTPMTAGGRFQPSKNAKHCSAGSMAALEHRGEIGNAHRTGLIEKLAGN
jgi:hypothetical protein